MQRAMAEQIRDACLARRWDVSIFYAPTRKHPQSPKDDPAEEINCSVSVHSIKWTWVDLKALWEIAAETGGQDNFAMIPGEGVIFR